MNIREHALKLLLDCEASGKYANLALSSHTLDSLSAEERSSITALFYTAVEHKITYDYLIGAFAKRSVDKLSAHTLNILRLGMCQILDMEKIPDFAAVNETVKLAKNSGERSLVNGVLRAAVRSKGCLPFPEKEKNPVRYYSVIYSLPLATVKHFIGMLGEEESVKLLEAFSAKQPTSLSVNTQNVTVDELAAELEKEGYAATRAAFSPTTVKVFGSVDPRKLPSFARGDIFVQDEASAICARALGAQAGERIIDVCAAPGGKSFALAILACDKAEVLSFDIHESKLSLIEGGAKRLGLSSVKAMQRDATTPDTALFGTADRVLCDAPCSGLGVIAKKPDLRYKSIEKAAELPSLQLSILTESAKYVKRGGVLVYSTCTLSDAENSAVVRSFLEANPDFCSVDFSVGELESSGGMLTLYPHLHGTDGFFIAKMKRNPT